MIPCCFHPTRVVVGNGGLDVIADLLGGSLPKSHMTFHPFESLGQALDYLNNGYQFDPFYKRYRATKEKGKNHPILEAVDIHHEIYRHQRFEEISTVVLHSHLPPYQSRPLGKTSQEISGLEFFQRLKNLHIQKILLVTSKEKEMAAQALRKGIINSYVCKDAPGGQKILNEALQNAQWEYFCQLSALFIKARRPHDFDKYPADDPYFQKFFRETLLKHGFTEAYLCEPTGSYLFLDSQAQDHGLVVNIQENLDSWVRSGKTRGIGRPLLKDLKNRKKMMCYHPCRGALEPDKGHWEIYAHPANRFQGRKNVFYYAFTSNMYDIDPERVLPFSKYRESQQMMQRSAS